MTTILVVDDERALTTMLRQMLQDAGYHVAVANNGSEALEMLPLVRPDLVLSDVMMPVLDGWALHRAMYADPAYRSIPFVFMSAAVATAQNHDLPSAAFLRKPFDLDSLLAVIAQAIG